MVRSHLAALSFAPLLFVLGSCGTRNDGAGENPSSAGMDTVQSLVASEELILELNPRLAPLAATFQSEHQVDVGAGECRIFLDPGCTLIFNLKLFATTSLQKKTFNANLYCCKGSFASAKKV